MSLPRNPVRRAWSEGRTAVNGWIISPGAITAEAMARAGWDSLTVDLQHGTADYASLSGLVQTAQRVGAAPMVRVPWLEEGIVMRALDAGALGIIAPMIDRAEDARRLVAACRYAPAGGRSFGPMHARYAWGDDYHTWANDEVLAFAMIETRSGVAALDDILAVPGLDGIYIGPADLSLSHGFAPGLDRREPEMLAVIDTIREKCVAAGLRCCLHCASPDYAAAAMKKGFSLVTIGSDVSLLEAAAASAVRIARS